MVFNDKPAVLITGASRGLGRRTAFAIGRRGYPLIVGARHTGAANELLGALRRADISAQPFVADLADLTDVRRAMAALEGVSLRGIVANAGISTLQDARSADGFELTFAVNVLAHHLLLLQLAPQVVDGGRIVIVASGVHEPANKLARRSGVPVPRWVGTRNLALPDQAPSDARLPPGLARYSTSKLANVVQARCLQAHFVRLDRSVDVFAIDPGLMVDTDLARELPGFLRPILRGLGYMFTPFVDNMRLSRVSAGHVASLIDDAGWQGRGFCYVDGDRIKQPSIDAQRDDVAADLQDAATALLGLEDAPGMAERHG